jgi:hypothetical protein
VGDGEVAVGVVDAVDEGVTVVLAEGLGVGDGIVGVCVGVGEDEDT